MARITGIVADGRTSSFQVTGHGNQYNAQIFGTWDGATATLQYRCGSTFDAALPWHDMPGTTGPWTADAEQGSIGLSNCQVALVIANRGASTDLSFEFTGSRSETILVVA